MTIVRSKLSEHLEVKPYAVEIKILGKNTSQVAMKEGF